MHSSRHGGNPDPQDLPMVTAPGVFLLRPIHTNWFPGSLRRKRRDFRGLCIQNGFLSVSHYSICYRERNLRGDVIWPTERENHLSPEEIEFVESMAPLIGEADNRFNLEEKMRNRKTGSGFSLLSF